jgi:hypothetical protein
MPSFNTNGIVYDVLPDGSGGFFIGGQFEWVSGTFSPGLAHVDINGNVIPGWSSPLLDSDDPPIIYCLLLLNGVLYAGGYIYAIGSGANSPRDGVIAVNPLTGVYIPAFDLQNTVSVRCMATDGTVIYIGGDFSVVQGNARLAIAAVDPVTGAPTSWDPQLTTVFPSTPTVVYAIKVFNGRIYVSGIFDHTNAGAYNHVNVASLDPVTAVANAWDGSFVVPTFSVTGLEVWGDTVFLWGMDFQPNPYGLIALDKDTAAPKPFTATAAMPPNSVDEARISGNTLYVAGRFLTANGQSRPSLAALDAASGSLVTDFDPRPIIFVAGYFIASLYVDVNTIYFGGSYGIFPDPSYTTFSIAGVTSQSMAILTYILSGLPQQPNILLLLRKAGHTILQWSQVTKDVNGDPPLLWGYRVYRSNSPNQENFSLIAEVTDKDNTGNFRTVFTEAISGFYAYAVSAFNYDGESGKSSQSCIDSVDLDSNF